MELIQECSLEGITKEFIVKVPDMPPPKGIADAPFRNETVNMGIPFQVSAKSMQNADEAGSKRFRFVLFVEHTGNNTVDGREKAVKEGTVFQKRGRSSSAIVKTQWRCVTSIILKDMEVVLSMAYMLPQVGQKRE